MSKETQVEGNECTEYFRHTVFYVITSYVQVIQVLYILKLGKVCTGNIGKGKLGSIHYMDQ